MPTRAELDSSINTQIQPEVNTADHRQVNKEMLDYVDQQDALKAPLASPTFTGVPTAPTAAAGAATTQIANTSFVTQALTTKADLVGGLVPSNQLPSYVDDVVMAANLASFPATGETGKIYVAEDTNLSYRWTGSSYIKVSSPIAISDVTGLQGALDLKAPLASPTFTGTPAAPTAAEGTNTTQLATTAFVQQEIAPKAPLASPTFTGTPAGPTAGSGTNTTQLATTAFVQQEIAPKAPLVSPALTGTPTAPTAPGGTNTTQIATTAFVQQEINGLNDVLEFTNLAAFPGTGVSGILYVALDTRIPYRWTGSAYETILPAITLTTNGSSGAATWDGITLNIPIYSSGGGGGNFITATIAQLKDGTITPEAGKYYYTTDAWKEGFWYWDASSTLTGDDGIVIDPVAAGNGRFLRVVLNNTVYLRWYNGATDYSPILASLWTQGYHVEGQFGSTYPLTTIISLTDENVSFNGNGCIFELTWTTDGDKWIVFDSTPIYQTGTTPWTVEAITGINNTATSTGNSLFVNIGLGGLHGSTYLQLAGDQTASLSRGDIIRLYSDDDFVTGFNAVLQAEFLVIERIAYDSGTNKTRVAFQGQTLYEYTVTASNTKIVKMPKFRFMMRNFRWKHVSAGVVSFCDIKGIYNPTLKDVTFENLSRSTVNFYGCYTYHVDNCIFSNVENEPDEGFAEAGAISGYGINDNQCFGGSVTNCKFYNLRHAWTTGTGTQTSSTHPWQRGETHTAYINGEAKGCAHAWDTHEVGTNIVFANCVTEGGGAAYQPRCRGVQIIGGSCTRVTTAVFVSAASFDTTPIQEPIIIDNLKVDKHYNNAGNTGNAIKIGASMVPVIIRNCTINGGNIWVDSLERTDIINCYINTQVPYGYAENSSYLTVDDGSEVHIHNCKVEYGSGTVYGIVLQAGSTSNKVYIDGLNIVTTKTSPVIINPGSTTLNTLVGKNITFTSASGPLNIDEDTFGAVNSDNVSAFSVLRLQWKTETLTTSVSSRNSKFMTHGTNGSTLTINPFGTYVLDETVYVKWQGTSASTVTTIANGAFLGQEMIIHNGSASAVNLVLPTLNGVARTLSQHQMARLVYSSTGGWTYLTI